MLATDALKRCFQCKEHKPQSEFWKNATKSDGLSTSCKPCRKSYMAARRATGVYAEADRARVRAWEAANPERRRETNAARQRTREARRRGADTPYVVSALLVLESTDGACGICGEDVDPRDFQIDHVVPIARGGEHAYHNLQPAHAMCNSKKGANLQEASYAL